MTDCLLRPMKPSDLERVRMWRNHSSVRQYMFATHEISLNEHQGWYVRTSKDPAISHLIYEVEGRPCGFLNISRTRCADVANWGFYLAPGAPRGSGRGLGKAGLNYAFVELKLHKVCGQALCFNSRSIAFHKSLGFTEEGCLREQHCTGAKFHDVICFGLLAKDWIEVTKESTNE